MSFVHAVALTIVAAGGLTTCCAVAVRRAHALWTDIQNNAPAAD